MKSTQIRSGPGLRSIGCVGQAYDTIPTSMRWFSFVRGVIKGDITPEDITDEQLNRILWAFAVCTVISVVLAWTVFGVLLYLLG